MLRKGSGYAVAGWVIPPPGPGVVSGFCVQNRGTRGRPYARGGSVVAGGYGSYRRWPAPSLPFLHGELSPYVSSHLAATTSPFLPDLLGFLVAADQHVQLPPPSGSRLSDGFRLTERRHRVVSVPPRSAGSYSTVWLAAKSAYRSRGSFRGGSCPVL